MFYISYVRREGPLTLKHHPPRSPPSHFILPPKSQSFHPRTPPPNLQVVNVENAIIGEGERERERERERGRELVNSPFD